MMPDGHDDTERFECPDCGATLDVDWIDVSTLGKLPWTEMVPGQMVCPTSRKHDLARAYELIRLVQVAHPKQDLTRHCSLQSLPRWRELGWYPTDPEHQTPTEMVHARVRLLARGFVAPPSGKVTVTGSGEIINT
jgi:hypothetical protein